MQTEQSTPAAKPFRNYFGGKEGSGAYQKIISLMPPHDVYIEAFLGNGSILRHKKPARVNIGIEKDESVCNAWNELKLPYVKVIHGCAISDLSRIANSNYTAGALLIYCDPPYLKVKRRSGADVYNYEMSARDHLDFLEAIKPMRCFVMVSHYENDLYNEVLKGWRKFHYQSKTRKGMATETVYCNFPETDKLHDDRYLGADRTDRQRIKRKVDRWVNKFSALPGAERELIWQRLKQSQEGK